MQAACQVYLRPCAHKATNADSPESLKGTVVVTHLDPPWELVRSGPSPAATHVGPTEPAAINAGPTLAVGTLDTCSGAPEAVRLQSHLQAV